MEIKNEYFSCSLDEINMIIKSRIEDFREYRKFNRTFSKIHQEYPEVESWPRIRGALIWKLMRTRKDIHYLNKLRHLMIRYNVRHVRDLSNILFNIIHKE